MLGFFKFLFLIGFFTMLTLCANSFAATIEMKDGSLMKGRLVHFYDNTLTLALSDGSQVKIQGQDLKQIVFGDYAAKLDAEKEKEQPPKEGRREFSTPERTFKTWRKAAMKGDIATMADSFIATAREPMIEKLEAISSEDRKRMIRDTKDTDFDVGTANIVGDRATLEVTRRLGKSEVTVVHTFKLENGEWKIVPD